MGSLMDRLRQMLGTASHGTVHDHIEAKMTEHELRLKVLDARIEADQAKYGERRRLTVPHTPDRRAR
jgi:hypothetical protein